MGYVRGILTSTGSRGPSARERWQWADTTSTRWETPSSRWGTPSPRQRALSGRETPSLSWRRPTYTARGVVAPSSGRAGTPADSAHPRPGVTIRRAGCRQAVLCSRSRPGDRTERDGCPDPYRLRGRALARIRALVLGYPAGRLTPNICGRIGDRWCGLTDVLSRRDDSRAASGDGRHGRDAVRCLSRFGRPQVP